MHPGEIVKVKDSAGKEWTGRLVRMDVERAMIGPPGEQVPGHATATITVVVEDAELTRR